MIQQEDVPKQAGDGAADASTANNTVDWDEARLEAGLNTLKDMHIQTRKFRSAIPHLVSTLAKKAESPQAYSSKFQESVYSTNRDLQTFKEFLLSEEVKEVVEHAAESAQKNPGPVKPWMYTEHPGWSMRKWGRQAELSKPCYSYLMQGTWWWMLFMASGYPDGWDPSVAGRLKFWPLKSTGGQMKNYLQHNDEPPISLIFPHTVFTIMWYVVVMFVMHILLCLICNETEKWRIMTARQLHTATLLKDRTNCNIHVKPTQQLPKPFLPNRAKQN